MKLWRRVISLLLVLTIKKNKKKKHIQFRMASSIVPQEKTQMTHT